jgi:hypothetical protein
MANRNNRNRALFFKSRPLASKMGAGLTWEGGDNYTLRFRDGVSMQGTIRTIFKWLQKSKEEAA